jgi:HPt (histidine-containing phosphotransfer) domain-containing protein
LRRCAGKQEFVEKVLSKFREQSITILTDLARGVHERNTEQATRTAHTLKGMAGTISATALQQCAAEAEQKSRASDWDAVQHQIEQLRAEIHRCIAFIEASKASKASTASTGSNQTCAS